MTPKTSEVAGSIHAVERALGFGRTDAAFTARPLACGALTAVCGLAVTQFFPGLSLGLFARGTAVLAGCLGGAPVVRVENGWLLGFNRIPVIVTEACSASDYFAILAGLIAWQLAAQGRRLLSAPLIGLFFSVPLTLGVNAMRVVFVASVHRWIIPLMPENCAYFLHQLAGVAVFLPSLIVFNFILETHGRFINRVRIGE